MPEEEIAQSSTEGLEAVEGVSGDEVGLAPDFFSNVDAETPDDATTAEAGLSQEGEDQSDGKEEVVATEAAPETVSPEELPTFYKYGDREFKDPEAVDNHLKTVEGRQRVTQASQQDALSKNNAWVDWSNNPEKVRKHLAELEGSKPEEVKVADEKKTFLKESDWNQLKTLVDKGRGMEALASMAHMFDQVMDNRLSQVEAKLSETIQPISDQRQAKEATVSLFTQAENVSDKQGNLVWPEFNRHSEQYDPQFCQMFAQVWQQLPAKVAWDEGMHGIEVAYNRTKQFLAAQGANTPAPVTEEEAAPASEAGAGTERAMRDEQGRFVKQTEDQATAVGGSGPTPPPNTGPADSYSEAAILRDMDRAVDRDPVFGIRR